MDPWLVTIITALIAAPPLTALVTGLLSRRESSLRVEASEATIRRDLYKDLRQLTADLDDLRERLRLSNERSDELSELVVSRDRRIVDLENNAAQSQRLIQSLQQQLIEAHSSVSALTREAGTAREREREMQGQITTLQAQLRAVEAGA